MAIRKFERTFKASLVKKADKGSAWLATYSITEDRVTESGIETVEVRSGTSAWSNASAAKRWVKEAVVNLTTRKSIKFEVTKEDLNGKPAEITASMSYKQGPMPL